MGNIVNAKLLATVANSIDIGCDILHFGNRQLEKQLGAENMSGDTVYVTEADGGHEFSGMTIDDTDLAASGVSRSTVPLKVNTKGCIYSLTQEQRDLMIKDSEFADKIMARFIDGRNAETYGVIAGGCTAMVVEKNSGLISSDKLVGAYFDALAGIEASKLKGNVVGIGNALTINAMAKALAQGTGIGVKNYGKELWKRGLADFAGLNWSKSGVLGTVQSTIAGCSQMNGYTVVTDDAGFKVITEIILKITSASKTAGSAITPFTIAGVNLCDALGNDTYIPATFEGKVKETTSSSTNVTVVLDRPIHFQSLDPMRNVVSGNVFGTTTVSSGLTDVAASVLDSSKTYHKPVVMFKEDDFFVAVKGLEAMKAQDSATVPTGFTEKGILPIRGTAWTDPKSSTTYCRFDAMFGSMMKRGIAGRKIYLEA